jgi:predicted transcriptional regulator
MSLDAELIARAGQLRSTTEIAKGLGVTDAEVYGWLTDGSELGQELLQILVSLAEQDP